MLAILEGEREGQREESIVYVCCLCVYVGCCRGCVTAISAAKSRLREEQRRNPPAAAQVQVPVAAMHPPEYAMFVFVSEEEKEKKKRRAAVFRFRGAPNTL